jgi:hypothetical protein
MANWFKACPQFLIGIVHFLLTFRIAKYSILNIASSVENVGRFFVARQPLRVDSQKAAMLLQSCYAKWWRMSLFSNQIYSVLHINFIKYGQCIIYCPQDLNNMFYKHKGTSKNPS